MEQRILVLFPGAWGCRTQEIVRWWFAHVIAFFGQLQGWRVIALTYSGQSLADYVASALKTVDNLPKNATLYALCYSMGAQVARGVCAARPRRFHKVALLGGLERQGVRFWPFLKSLWTAWWPLVRGLFTGAVMFTTWQQVWRIMYSGKVGAEPAAQEMFQHMAPEPTRVILALAFPGLRQRLPPLRYLLLAIRPGCDFFVADADYVGETRIRYPVPYAPHALLRDSQAMPEVLGDLLVWFNQDRS